MKNDILARRYAKALFVVGKEEGALDEYAETLQAFSELYASTPEVVDGLTNKMYPADVRAKVMSEIVKSAGVSVIMANFSTFWLRKIEPVCCPR
jgi:F-type H+-transporting ATPase subunit delta